MAENEINSDWIDRYHDGELEEAEKKIFLERLQSNALLRTEVDVDARLNRFLEDEALIDLMTKVQAASRKNHGSVKLMHYMLIAASVLFPVIVAGMFYLFADTPAHKRSPGVRHVNSSHQGDVEKPVLGKSRPTARHHGDNACLVADRIADPLLLASNFKPLAEYELLVGSVTRSALFYLISPKGNDTIREGNMVTFSWRCTGESGLLKIIVLSNRGVPVMVDRMPASSTMTLPTDKLIAGVYYWKILAGDDFLLMGKMTILPD